MPSTRRTTFTLENQYDVAITDINIDHWSSYDFPDDKLNPDQLKGKSLKAHDSASIELELREGASYCQFNVTLLFENNNFAKFRVVQRDAFENIKNRRVDVSSDILAIENSQDNQPSGFYGTVEVALATSNHN